jgi:hypothetical protein
MTLTRGLTLACLAAAAALTGCGGGSALDNSQNVQNPQGSSGRKLSFEYFQRCIQPIYEKVITGAGGGANTCGSSGCHDTVAGTGGALRIVPRPSIVDSTTTPVDVIQASEMFRNFYSSQGVTVIGAPTASRLFQKPLILNILHGGGQIFADENDENARLIAYWITHPMPEGQDEFSVAANSLFTPADPKTGVCNDR